MANISSSNGLEKRPKLRFPGFDEPWKAEMLSDFSERVTRKNTKNETNLPLTISSKDGLVDQISYFNKMVASKDISSYYLLKEGEYAYNKSYSVGYDFGSIKRLDRYPMGALSTLYICFALKRHNSDFIRAYFDSLKWYREIYMISAEGARNHGLLNVPTEDFFQTIHYLPQDTREQRKIASFIITLDRRIDAQQSLVKSFKKYKRGLLKDMFPQEDATVPKLRLAGFTGDWVQHNLGDLMNVTSVKRIHQSDWTNSGVRFLRARDIVAAAKNEKVSEPLFISQEKYNEYSEISGKVKKGDLLVTGVGTIGVPMLINSDEPLYFKDGNIIWFKNENIIDGKFFYYSFVSDGIQKFILESAGTGTVGTYTIDSGRKTPVYLPVQREEQIQIGKYFSQLDALIVLHQRKLDILMQCKNGIVQQLFI